MSGNPLIFSWKLGMAKELIFLANFKIRLAAMLFFSVSGKLDVFMLWTPVGDETLAETTSPF
jgi:hypothetical protein